MGTSNMLVFLILFVVGAIAAQDPLVVQTVQGKIRGSILKTYTGKDIFSFRDIKYAESTSGENRFKPPVPIKPWEGIRNATEDGTLCPQAYYEDNTSPDTEDCLSINVYTKNLGSGGFLAPVLVFIHQGGFMTGSGYSRLVGPQYLLDLPIVLVTMNYRVGALGFVNTDDGVLRGNNGMKDQVLALRWVQENVERFGGDPKQVTLYGNSAGSASVMYHMLSPMSKGLFGKAICASGAILGGWAINRNPEGLARRLAEAVGCPWVDTNQVYNCLKGVPPQQIQDATLQIKDFGLDPFSNFAPVLEKDYGDGQERFISEDPLSLIQQGKFAQVNMLTGITRNEISFRADLLLGNATLAEQFDREYKKYFPVEFHYGRITEPYSAKISEELRQFYFGNKAINNETLVQLGQAFADSHLIFNGIQTAKLFAEKSSRPVYFYQFDYEGRYTTFFYPALRQNPGVLHSDDLLYLFRNDLYVPLFKPTDPEGPTIRLLLDVWYNFIYTGKPTARRSKVDWPPLQKNNYKYVKISDKLTTVNGLPFPKRMAVWERLFPLSGPRQFYF